MRRRTYPASPAAIGRHRGLIKFRLGESAAFIVLGGIALKFSGLEAFAVVVSLTLLITSLVLLPQHVCHIVELPLKTYIMEGCLKPCLVTIPLAAVLYGMHSRFEVRSWFGLSGMLAASSLVYLATVAWMTFSPVEKAGNQWLSLGILEVLADHARPILSKVRNGKSLSRAGQRPGSTDRASEPDRTSSARASARSPKQVPGEGV